MPSCSAWAGVNGVSSSGRPRHQAGLAYTPPPCRGSISGASPSLWPMLPTTSIPAVIPRLGCPFTESGSSRWGCGSSMPPVAPLGVHVCRGPLAVPPRHRLAGERAGDFLGGGAASVEHALRRIDFIRSPSPCGALRSLGGTRRYTCIPHFLHRV